MIFVTVGSQKFPFNRLIEKVDQMAGEKVITEEVFIQTGAGSYIPRSCSYQAFYDRDHFTDMIEQCSILITHGGAGTVVDAVKRRKKVIVVPRLARYGEHVNDHQLQLAGKFYEMNLAYMCRDLNDLPKMVERIRNHVFDSYSSNTEAFLASVDKFICC